MMDIRANQQAVADARDKAERLRNHKLATWDTLLSALRVISDMVASMEEKGYTESEYAAAVRYILPEVRDAIEAAEKEPS